MRLVSHLSRFVSRRPCNCSVTCKLNQGYICDEKSNSTYATGLPLYNNDMKFIALLQGISVGGNNKVAMTTLKERFEELGFYSVSTYINSSDIIYS